MHTDTQVNRQTDRQTDRCTNRSKANTAQCQQNIDKALVLAEKVHILVVKTTTVDYRDKIPKQQK